MPEWKTVEFANRDLDELRKELEIWIYANRQNIPRMSFTCPNYGDGIHRILINYFWDTTHFPLS